MRICTLRKKSGGTRRIYAVNGAERDEFRRWLPELHAIQERILPPHVAHGFVRGRSPVTNAWWHRGYRFTLSLDMADWFDSVTPRHLAHVPESAGWGPLFVDGVAGQGLPTSPLVANIAASQMDWEIASQRSGWVYTRYADDLTASATTLAELGHAERVIREAVRRRCWRISEHKRRVMDARHGRRIITGVAVDDETHPTRRMKRLERAARHQQRKAEAGLIGGRGW